MTAGEGGRWHGMMASCELNVGGPRRGGIGQLLYVAGMAERYNARWTT